MVNRKSRGSIQQGEDTCRTCGARTHPEGLLSRLVRWILQSLSGSGVVRIKTVRTIGRPGAKTHTYGTWEELPPQIKSALANAEPETSLTINFEDRTTGERQTFHNWDEVPPELWERIPPEIQEKLAAGLSTAPFEAGSPEAGECNVLVDQSIRSKVVDVNTETTRFDT